MSNAKSSDTVIVASKLPFDFILRIHAPHTEYEQVLGGGQREVTRWYPLPGAQEYVIKGNSYDKNPNPLHGETFGYALTRDIPKQFWDQWLSQNKDADFIRNEMIFASTETASIKAQSKANESNKSGMERLDRNNLPKNIAKVKPA